MQLKNNYLLNNNSYNDFGAANYHKNWGRFWRKDKRSIDQFISLLNGKEVVDLGAGSGEIVEYFQSKNLLPTFVDFSQSMVQFAQSNLKDIPIIRSNITNLPIGNESFDGVFSRFVLQHLLLRDYKKALLEIIRITKLNGLIYLSLHIREENELDVRLIKWPDTNLKIRNNLVTKAKLESLLLEFKLEIIYQEILRDSNGKINGMILILHR